MVKKVVVAGGAGDIGREVVDRLIDAGHEVTVLTRRDVADPKADGINWVKADYSSATSLVPLIKGADVVLSFVTVETDQNNVTQKNLIDACLAAGVKRFVPSEWGAKSNSGRLSYSVKDEIRKYLEGINREKKVLEYTLFQCGIGLEYFSHPHKTTKHVGTLALAVDIQNCRAILPNPATSPPHTFVTTSFDDVGEIVARAIDYEGEWPTVGSISGNVVTLHDIVAIGEKVRGKKFAVEYVEIDDLAKHELKTSWVPKLERPTFPNDKKAEISVWVCCDMLGGIQAGAWSLGQEWNEKFPDHKFKSMEDFLRSVPWSD